MAPPRTTDPDSAAGRRPGSSVRIELGEELDVEVAALARHRAGSAARAERRKLLRRRRRRARARTAALLAFGFAALGGGVYVATHLPSSGTLNRPVALQPARAPLAAATPHRPRRLAVRAEPAPIPGHPQLARARAFARSRAGLVSFAVVDSRGREHALAGDRRYVSASVVKAMLLVAELDRLRTAGAPLDPNTRAYLEAMITYSDNASADVIYDRVGDPGLFAVARRAGLRRFTVSGYWANAQLTARDMARLMAAIDRLLIGSHADFGSTLFERIVSTQRWGVPAVAAEHGWDTRFKGGWRGTERGQLVHQIAHLRRGDAELSLAVLTDGSPTMAYGIETVRGIAERLLSDPRRGARERPWSARWEW